MSEDAALEAKIAALSQRIGHGQAPSKAYRSSHASQQTRYSPYPSTKRNVPAPRHRHYTLINTNIQGKTASEDATSPANVDSPITPNVSGVSTRDRGHMTWTNSAVYDKKVQQKQHAMQLTAQARQRARDQRQITKVISAVYGAAPQGHSSGKPTANVMRDIVVNDLRFRVALNGSKLVRIYDGPRVLAQETPKQVKVAGVTFYRSKSGNLHRSGLVKQQRKNINKKSTKLCQAFTSTGSCSLGNRCRFTHDVDKLAICKDFLRGACAVGEQACNLSHSADPHRVPHCTHFLRGSCTKPRCLYAHVETSPDALVCRDFALLGYCAQGAGCSLRHVMNECPDYTNTGTCSNKSCRLNHIDRAGALRKAAGHTGGEDDSDLSSDDGQHDAIDSDDVDSDDMADVGSGDEELSGQQDFVGLR